MRELPVIHRSRGLVCLSARAFIINRFDISFILMLWTFCINLSNASAFLVPPLCLLWPTNSVHWAITVATTVPPFGDHGNPSATLAMVLPPLCLLCATCCATTAERLQSRVDRACKFNTTEWHSERWRPLCFHESEITKFVLSYLAKK